MAAEVRQPVAIRVTRPYSDEDEFLEREIDTLTRTSVTLIGAQSRPQGVILRFEVALSNGAPLMRGEGRVIAFKTNALGPLSGLTLRFTRLDKKTKALVDRAALIREERARAALHASMLESAESELPPPPPATSETAILAEPSSPDAASVESPDATGAGFDRATQPDPPPAPAPHHESHEPNGASSIASGRVTSGRDRDSLLLRLRERARRLAPETVAAILQDAPTSTPE